MGALHELGMTSAGQFWEAFAHEVDLDSLPSHIRAQYIQDPVAGLHMERDHKKLLAAELAAMGRLSLPEQEATRQKYRDYLASIGR